MGGGWGNNKPGVFAELQVASRRESLGSLGNRDGVARLASAAAVCAATRCAAAPRASCPPHRSRSQVLPKDFRPQAARLTKGMQARLARMKLLREACGLLEKLKPGAALPAKGKLPRLLARLEKEGAVEGGAPMPGKAECAGAETGGAEPVEAEKAAEDSAAVQQEAKEKEAKALKALEREAERQHAKEEKEAEKVRAKEEKEAEKARAREEKEAAAVRAKEEKEAAALKRKAEEEAEKQNKKAAKRGFASSKQLAATSNTFMASPPCHLSPHPPSLSFCA